MRQSPPKEARFLLRRLLSLHRVCLRFAAHSSWWLLALGLLWLLCLGLLLLMWLPLHARLLLLCLGLVLLRLMLVLCAALNSHGHRPVQIARLCKSSSREHGHGPQHSGAPNSLFFMLLLDGLLLAEATPYTDAVPSQGPVRNEEEVLKQLTFSPVWAALPAPIGMQTNTATDYARGQLSWRLQLDALPALVCPAQALYM
jgi:hypothetical protein